MKDWLAVALYKVRTFFFPYRTYRMSTDTAVTSNNSHAVFHGPYWNKPRMLKRWSA